MHRGADERVAPAPIEFAMVTNARALGQRLQRRAQRGATDFVEDALDEDHTIVGSGQGQAARLHALFLFVHETLGVGGMPSMHAFVVEAPDAELARLLEQPRLPKTPPTRPPAPPQHPEVRETNPPSTPTFL